MTGTICYIFLLAAFVVVYAGTPEFEVRYDSQESNHDPAYNSAPWMEEETMCNISSTGTNVSGANVPLGFIDQYVRLSGHVTGETIDVDGGISTWMPCSQAVASVSGLARGDHDATLIGRSSRPGGTVTSPFKEAVFTVSTGLASIRVNRSIKQNSGPMQYMTLSPSTKTTDYNGVSDMHWDVSFCALGGKPSCSISIPWSVDQVPGNLPLPSKSANLVFHDQHFYYTSIVSNCSGDGHSDLHYVAVTSESSHSANRLHAALFIVPIIVGLFVFNMFDLFSGSDDDPPDDNILNMDPNLPRDRLVDEIDAMSDNQ